MAVRRTLKQKQRAQLQRERALSYSLTGLKTVPTTFAAKKTTSQIVAEPSMPPTHGPELSEIFGYSPNLLKQDILKTLITTILVVAVLLLLKYRPLF